MSEMIALYICFGALVAVMILIILMALGFID